MIVNERIVSYIHSLEKSNGPLLDEMEAYAKENRVPIIRKEVESFLRVLLEMQHPTHILELGTAIGYSAILMGGCIDENSRITTIENYEKRIPVARKNFERAGRMQQITLLEGDAAVRLKELTEPCDLIFMDAAKGQYIHFMDDVLRLLKPGGILVSDNVLQDGDIIESRFAVTRRNRTIHKRMRDYLYQLTHHEELRTSVLPFGDGVTVSVKLGKEFLKQNR